MSATVNGFLLTRSWRDTPQGLELVFWGATSSGPVRLIVKPHEAVCFIARDQAASISGSTRRVPLKLRSMTGQAIDGLYFRYQRDLNTLRRSGVTLAESDVKPTDRYLMERFVHAGFEVHGKRLNKDGVDTFVNAQLKAIEETPSLSALSVDIETRGHSQQLYSIACASLNDTAHNDAVFMIGSGADEQRENYTLTYCCDERTVLQTCFNWLNERDPDLILGWSITNFDLDFLDRKCRSLGIAFQIGRAGESATVLQPNNPGQPRVARIPGRAVLDGIDLLKAGFWSFESFSLENVSNQLLGEGKLISPTQNKVAEINRLFRDNKPTLADYNIKDCRLVNDIFIKAKLIEFAMQRASLTGLAIDRLGGSVAAFDNLYLPKLHRKGYVASDVHADTDGLGSPGGYVLDSEPGLYKNILVLDFKSLYPSIIRTFCIDPLGLAQPGKDPVPGFLDGKFSREIHILPGLIENLWSARDEAKHASNAPLSQAIKIIMNSFYGVLGTNGCRFHSQQLASSITRRGHEIITRSEQQIEAMGYRVIYGDTDSLFVLLGDSHTRDAAQQIGKRIMKELNSWWKETLRSEFQLESYLEVEFETHYTHFLMPTVRGMPTGSKKRYAGLVDNGKGDPRLIVKGLEAARTDWTPLARNFQRELFRRIFLDIPYEAYVLDTSQALLRGDLDDSLIYRKRLRRKLNDYQRNVPPHVQAARKLPHAGSWVSYIITRHGPEPIEALHSPPDYQHYMDKQLAPAADGILQFLDTSFAAITDAQMSMF